MVPERPLVYCTVLHCGISQDGSTRMLLRETLDSLQRTTYPHFKLGVIDNGSTDGSQAMVSADYPGVQLIENEQNLGVIEGYNIGLRYGLKQGAEWVLLLNNDIRVDSELLSNMILVAESDKQIGIVGPKILYYSQPRTIWYAGGKINYFTGIISHRGIREIDRGQYDRIEETDYVTGCALLVCRKVVEVIGLLDPAYSPMYSEDADFSVRARRAGFRVMYAPHAQMWHKVSASTGGDSTPLKTQLKVEHNLVFFKRYARWYHWLTIPWCVAAVGVVFVFRELVKGNFSVIVALFRGFVKAIRRLGS